jgi:hypothetical protein
MKLDTADFESHNAWWRIGHYLRQMRDWLEDGNGPYSPLLCLSLLLVVGVVAKTWH